MKTKTFTLLILFGLTIYCKCYAQSGLNKSKDELVSFINRPAYAALYPEVIIDEKSIVTFSKDLKKGVFYSFNAFKRCTGEVMSERLNANNYLATLNFLKGYLKSLNYELSPDADNKYFDSRNRITGVIESNGEWLNIIFKKY